MINYLFDVDGTLTPPRSYMNHWFRVYFYIWMTHQQELGNRVFFVTGSDKKKTIEQVSKRLWYSVDGIYQNSGNQLYVRGELIKESQWVMPDDLRKDITKHITKSDWYGVADNNIEERVGMVNISTIGRDVDNPLRIEYYKWDNENNERRIIVSDLSAKYPELNFAIGGEISIDIHPLGKDKGQVLADMEGETVYFGDKCYLGGNDYNISVGSDECYKISSWKDTRSILRSLINE